MFSQIIKKARKKALNDKYLKLMKESFTLSHIDRVAGDKKRSEAEEVLRKLESL